MKIFRNSHTFGVKITERCEFSVPVTPFGTDISTLQAVTKVTKITKGDITKGDRPLLEPLLELQKLTPFDVKSQKSVSFLLQKGSDPYLNFKNSHLRGKNHRKVCVFCACRTVWNGHFAVTSSNKGNKRGQTPT